MQAFVYSTLACCQDGMVEEVFREHTEVQLQLDWTLCRAHLQDLQFPPIPSSDDFAAVADGRNNSDKWDAETKLKVNKM